MYNQLTGHAHVAALPSSQPRYASVGRNDVRTVPCEQADHSNVQQQERDIQGRMSRQAQQPRQPCRSLDDQPINTSAPLWKQQQQVQQRHRTRYEAHLGAHTAAITPERLALEATEQWQQQSPPLTFHLSAATATASHKIEALSGCEGLQAPVCFPAELMGPLFIFPGKRRIQVEVDGVQQSRFQARQHTLHAHDAGLSVRTSMDSLIVGTFHRGWQVFDDGTDAGRNKKSTPFLRDRTLLLVLSTTPCEKMTLGECMGKHFVAAATAGYSSEGSPGNPTKYNAKAAVLIRNEEVLFPVQLMQPLSILEGYRRVQVEVDGVQQPLRQATCWTTHFDDAGLSVRTCMREQIIGTYHRGWQVFDDSYTNHGREKGSVAYLRDRTLLLVLSTTPCEKMTLGECMVLPAYALQKDPPAWEGLKSGDRRLYELMSTKAKRDESSAAERQTTAGLWDHRLVAASDLWMDLLELATKAGQAWAREGQHEQAEVCFSNAANFAALAPDAGQHCTDLAPSDMAVDVPAQTLHSSSRSLSSQFQLQLHRTSTMWALGQEAMATHTLSEALLLAVHPALAPADSLDMAFSLAGLMLVHAIALSHHAETYLGKRGQGADMDTQMGDGGQVAEQQAELASVGNATGGGYLSSIALLDQVLAWLCYCHVMLQDGSSADECLVALRGADAQPMLRTPVLLMLSVRVFSQDEHDAVLLEWLGPQSTAALKRDSMRVVEDAEAECYGLTWNRGVVLFDDHRFLPAAKFFEAAACYSRGGTSFIAPGPTHATVGITLVPAVTSAAVGGAGVRSACAGAVARVAAHTRRAIALCHMGAGELESAIQHLDRCDTLLPGESLTAFLRFKVCLLMGDAKAAVAAVASLALSNEMDAGMLETACTQAVSAKAFPAASEALQQLHTMAVTAADLSKAQRLSAQPLSDAERTAAAAQKPSASEATLFRIMIQIVIDEAAAAAAGPTLQVEPGRDKAAGSDTAMTEAAAAGAGAHVAQDGKEKSSRVPAVELAGTGGKQQGGVAKTADVHSRLTKLLNSAGQRLRVLGWEAFCGIQPGTDVTPKLYEQALAQLEWLSQTAHNSGLAAIKAHVLQPATVMLATAGSIVAAYPSPNLKQLQLRKLCHLLAATAALEVHSASDPPHAPSLPLAAVMLKQAHEARTAAVSKFAHVADKADMFLFVQEWHLLLSQQNHPAMQSLLESSAARLPATLLTPGILISCAEKAAADRGAAAVVLAAYRLALLRVVEAPTHDGAVKRLARNDP
ncbi:MAG: hypothetical protein WDW38_008770 [Sanguina aurantia]